MRKILLFKLQIKDVFLFGLLVVISFLCLNSTTIVEIQAINSFEIIQDAADETKPLKPFIYVGERMDWDVIIDGSAVGGTAAVGYSWKSSDSTVVSIENIDTVDCTGILVAKSKGTATITAKAPDGRTATATIRIKQPATSIHLASSATAYVGKPLTLSTTINPSTTDDKNNGVVWSSSNSTIATVNATTGSISAKKNGSVIITAIFTNKDRFGTTVPATVSAKSTVTVRTNVSYIKLNTTIATLYKGRKSYLRATVYPSTASNKAYTWKSSNTKIVAVNSKGQIYARYYGEAYITATSKDGNKRASARIIVPRLQKGTSLTNNYIYNFDNSSYAFLKSGQKRNYSMYTKDKNNLINKIYSRHKNEETREEIKYFVNDTINSKWGGSCFGMSMTTALNMTGQVNIKSYTKSKGKGRQLSKVKYPKNSGRVKSTINFYQVMTPYYFDDYRNFYNYNNTKDRVAGLKSIVTTAKRNQLQSFDFYSKSSGHAILIKNYNKVVKIKRKNYYRLNTYDSNYPKKKTYVYIRTDYKVMIVQYYNWKLNSFDVLSNFKEYDYAKINK